MFRTPAEALPESAVWDPKQMKSLPFPCMLMALAGFLFLLCFLPPAGHSSCRSVCQWVMRVELPPSGVRFSFLRPGVPYRLHFTTDAASHSSNSCPGLTWTYRRSEPCLTVRADWLEGRWSVCCTLCSMARKGSRGTAPLSRGLGFRTSGGSSITLFLFLLGGTGAGLGTGYKTHTHINKHKNNIIS